MLPYYNDMSTFTAFATCKDTLKVDNNDFFSINQNYNFLAQQSESSFSQKFQNVTLHSSSIQIVICL